MFKLSRLLITYVMAVPLALLLGYLVTTLTPMTFTFVGALLFFFATPIFLKWHHVLLIFFWNSVFFVFFLPGSPSFQLLFAFLSFAIAFLNHIMFQKPFLRAPELTRPLLFFTAVVLVTAEYRGGIGIRAFGGNTFGGRYYVFVLGAIAGYFALTSEAIPIEKSDKMSGLFFLSGTSSALSNVIFTLGPLFYFLYYIVPSGAATSQAMGEAGLTQIERLTGLAPACTAAMCFLLARYGVRGLFDIGKPWRFMLLLLTVVAAFFAGFRSIMAILFLIFAIQFYYEGLLRTHFLPIIVGLAVCGLLPILFFANSMPPAVQRAISFLPVNVDSAVLQDAHATTAWRLEMWGMAVKEIPRYLLIGKGYAIDPGELYSAVQASQMGYETNPYETTMMSGDYHSGPLSVIIPFGIFGTIGFIWVLIGGYRVLSWNRRYGDPRLRRVNTVLLSFYVAQCLSFVFIFGALNTELSILLGACGLSVSLNGGVRRRVAPRRPPEAVPQRTLVMEAG
jgi:hypothetical protein